MTDINIDTDVLRRALDGDEEAREEVRAMLPTLVPTTGLLGRWAKHPEYGDVLITVEKPNPDEIVFVTYLDEEGIDGTGETFVPIDELKFSEQTTDPEDVPVGEAWLVEIYGKRVHATKDQDGDWLAPEASRYWRSSSEITLISPLVPARPVDDGEWVETVEEYEALPDGSIVVADGCAPMLYTGGVFRYGPIGSTASRLAGTRRRVLRKGWVE